MTNLNFFSLDLENNQPSNTIIQTGYVIGNLESGIIHEKICRNVRVEEKIDERITKLTGISQEDVDSGISLNEAYGEMQALHSKYGCFRNPITWGGGG